MKNILIYANTYMQVISAIQIRLKLYPEDQVDLIISDHSVGAGDVAYRLSEEKGLFRKVRFVKTHYVEFEQSSLKDIADALLISIGDSHKYKKILNMWDISYDDIFYYNLSIVLYPILDLAYRSNKKVRFVRFEEGLASYHALLKHEVSARLIMLQAIRKALGRINVNDLQKAFCCYYPHMLKEQATAGNINAIRNKELITLPLLTRADCYMTDVLNRIFDYCPASINYNKRYIYFATSSDIDGYSVGETELVWKIAKLVGKENLLIKMHPRDNRSIYEEAGLAVIRESNVPWEIAQLNKDFKDQVFLSLTSGSILNATAMLGDSVKTWYLWNCVTIRNDWLEKNINGVTGTLGGLWNIGMCRNIRVAEKLEDILR